MSKDKFAKLLNKMETPEISVPLQKTVPITIKESEPEEKLNVMIPSNLLRKLNILRAKEKKKLKEIVYDALIEKYGDQMKDIE